MVREHIQGMKELNTDCGKELNTGLERNPYKVGKNYIQGGKKLHTRREIDMKQKDQT